MSVISSLKQVCLSKKYSDIYLLKSSMDLGFGILLVNMGFILREEFGIGEQLMSYIMISFCVCTVIANTVLVKVNKIWKYSDSAGGRKKIISGPVTIASGFVTLALVEIFPYYLLTLTGMMVTRTFFDSTITEALLLRTGDESKSLVLGTSENLYLFFDMVCPIASGLLIEMFGFRMSYVACSFILLLGSLIFNLMPKPKIAKD